VAESQPHRDELGRTPANQSELLGALIDHEVAFLVIGGVAVGIHGYPRTTWDLDIIPEPSEANLRRLAAALESLQAKAADAQGRSLELDLSHPASLAVGNYFLATRAGALDLVNGARPDLIRYRELERSAIPVRLLGHVVQVIGLDDLIRLKREAGRDKDLRDIAAIEAVRRRSIESG
jgi:hypothetical protein